jgi:uncharacterized membrane protein
LTSGTVGYPTTMRRLRFMLGHRLRTSLWLIPFGCALVGILLSVATVWIDRSLQTEIVPRSVTGDPNAALMILSTVAASMVSLTALVLTITSVVVQLAMGQFSPRSVRPFLQDRPSQFAIGIFVGAFAHAMFAMREVRSSGPTGSVPGVTIVTSYVLVFVSVVVLVAYVHHIGYSLKVDSIIHSVAHETRDLFDKLYRPETASVAPPTEGSLITSQRAGFLFHVDHEGLVNAAAEANVTIRLLHPLGRFVPLGAPLLEIDGAPERPLDTGPLRDAVALGAERTMDQDVAFGLQTLVDIAERALSEDFSDQTTAAQVVDYLHDLLRSLAYRSLPTGRFEDAGGALRLVVPELTWEDYVGVAFDDLAVAAAGSSAVTRHLREVMEELAAYVPTDRRAPVERRLREWDPDARDDSAHPAA